LWQSREIPNPSHSTPLPLLAHSLHKNLFHIRTSFLNVLSSTDIQIISAREEVEVALERERLGRVEEKRAREVAEVELGECHCRGRELGTDVVLGRRASEGYGQGDTGTRRGIHE
jgi:hypothetical protein